VKPLCQNAKRRHYIHLLIIKTGHQCDIRDGPCQNTYLGYWPKQDMSLGFGYVYQRHVSAKCTCDVPILLPMISFTRIDRNSHLRWWNQRNYYHRWLVIRISGDILEKQKGNPSLLSWSSPSSPHSQQPLSSCAKPPYASAAARCFPTGSALAKPLCHQICHCRFPYMSIKD
jgi:hypothetical protein